MKSFMDLFTRGSSNDIVKIELYREEYYEDRTLGKLFINGKFFGHTLEDKVRDNKVYGETAIFEDVYVVEMTYSPKYGKFKALISNVKGFFGIRVHGGNGPADTLGCILVAKYRNYGTSTPKIWGSLEKEFNKVMRKVHADKRCVYLHIYNTGGN